ncbi:MFS domain-containing protein [Fusarium falciforme]|uniref:MFS domain-containing protein n=1 Tax=Fusarium falciforme TaxID=195108 RepID=UPI0023012729|nr:MFS domain-containing protein [Fusarium falciforme]WAO91410.1 MFS domain-containing protein [Fusarium falciforme]
MASYPPAQCCTTGFRHEGTPQGKDIRIAGGKYAAYLATPPPDKAKKSTAVLYLPDIMGVWQNSRLLADEFAANGYLTLLLDTFNGDPIPVRSVDADEVNIAAWLAGGSTGDNPHNEPAVDPIVKDAIKVLKEEYGVKKLGAVGYCFGAKYLVRHFNEGIDVGYLAHPSFVNADELAAINGPISIAAAETDHIFPPEKRHETEDILLRNGKTYQLTLFSKVAHGFAVRSDVSKREQKWAKEQAFYQAIVWFNEYLE